MACSKNSSDTDFFHYDTSLSYNENLLVLDSISACIDDEMEWERFFKQDSVFIKRQGDKEIIVFPSQLNTLRRVVSHVNKAKPFPCGISTSRHSSSVFRGCIPHRSLGDFSS